jgi:RNA polymerase sigma-70 factor (ECF subfamily)
MLKRIYSNFDKIYLFYAEKIKNYFRPRVSNDEFIAEDLTSQTFEKAIKNIQTFKWQGVSFSSWLYKIANNN